MDRQCSSCGGFCKKSGCERENVKPEPEPVAWMHNFIDDVITKNRPTDITRNAGRWTPLYTAPPAKEWVGLTDGEYELMAEKRVTNYFFNTLDYAHAIEAKLQEKNT